MLWILWSVVQKDLLFLSSGKTRERQHSDSGTVFLFCFFQQFYTCLISQWMLLFSSLHLCGWAHNSVCFSTHICTKVQTIKTTLSTPLHQETQKRHWTLRFGLSRLLTVLSSMNSIDISVVSSLLVLHDKRRICTGQCCRKQPDKPWQEQQRERPGLPVSTPWESTSTASLPSLREHKPSDARPLTEMWILPIHTVGSLTA